MSATSTAWKEARRLQALSLKRKGWKQTRIAEALGVTQAAVSQWFSTLDNHNAIGLLARPHTGRPPELTREQKNLIPDLLSHGAEAYGFRGDVWTNLRVAKVIEWEWAVTYHRSHVARLLKELQWTPQLPVVRATQRDEDAIALWRSEQWPELQKQARLERKTLVFVDESGFYLLPARVRTYAPRGHTPTLRVFETRDHLSVMSAITSQGWLFTMVRDDSLTSVESVRFLKHLLAHLNRKLLVIWDGSPIHRGREVKAYLADGAAKQIHLERLPAYAPDLNPDEGVWSHLKYVELRNTCCLDLTHLRHQFDLAVTRLRRKPHLIQSFFAGAQLAI
jgi:transposase